MKRFKVKKDKKAHTSRKWCVVDAGLGGVPYYVHARCPDKRSAKHYAAILNRRPNGI
jgi:hypothetical protein